MLKGNSNRRPVVLIHVDSFPPPGMPFVLSQGNALQEFVPYFSAVRRINHRGLQFPADRTLVVNAMPGIIGKFKEMPFRRLGFAPIYVRRLRKVRPVLLHAHSGFAGISALHLATRLEIPLITTFHGRDATIKDFLTLDSRYGMREYVRRRHVLMSKGQLFIAVSRFMKTKMLEIGIPEQKIVVHYTGIDTEFFRPDPAVAREPIVLFVARLEEMKGCEYAIRAMATVQSRVPAAELVIIGDGSQRAELEHLASQKLHRYRFLGTQPPEVVRHWMNRARVFTVPSVTARSGETETFGMVFGEAQAMYLPVVSFASGGISEAVAAGETGFLAKERDWETLAVHIETLLRREDLWRKMTEAGRNRVCSDFNLRTQTALLERIYRGMTFPAYVDGRTRETECSGA